MPAVEMAARINLAKVLVAHGRRRRVCRTVQAGSSHLFGGRKISFHQQRRHGEDVADIVESVAAVVRRKICRRLKIDTEQVPNCVGVFSSVQPRTVIWPGLGRRKRSARSNSASIHAVTL